MTIAVQHGSSRLTFLLFVRAAWQIEGIDLPSPAPHPSAGDSHRPAGVDDDTLREGWQSAWSDALADLTSERIPRPVDTETRARIDAMSLEELQAAMTLDDPRKTGVFADGVDLSALAEWHSVIEARPNGRMFDEQPERVNLLELVPAWRAGLRTITALPIADHWARRIDESHLVVASCTRLDREKYGRALSLPIEPDR